jgi:hypothetical protein
MVGNPPPAPAPEGYYQRLYYCRYRPCGTEVGGSSIPTGWYSLMRSRGPLDSASRLGLYCTLECLYADRQRLQDEEARLAERSAS